MPLRLNPLTSFDALPVAWQDYQPIRAEYSQPETMSWVGDDEHLIAGSGGSHGFSITAFGEARLILNTLHELDLGELNVNAANLPRGVFEDEAFNVPWLTPVEGREDYLWEQMIIDSPPPRQDAAGMVIELDSAWNPAISELLAVANPTTEHSPDDAESVGWWGVPDDEAGLGERRLLSVVGAIAPNRHDSARMLVAVGTHPDARRRGLAGATVTAATRAGLKVEPYVTLGMWSHNDAARRLYEGLGYRLLVRMTTRVFAH